MTYLRSKLIINNSKTEPMLKHLKSLDIFGQNLSFNANKGSNIFKTASGGLLTLLALLLMFLISLSIFMSFLKTSRPVVSVNKIRLEKPNSLNFQKHKTGMFYIVYANNKWLTTKEAAKYVTFRAVQTEKTSSQGPDPKQAEVKKTAVEYKNCAEFETQYIKDNIQTGLTGIESTLNLTKFFSDSILCGNPQRSDKLLKGSRFNYPFRSFTVKIYPCSLPNPRDCATIQDLTTLKIGNIFFTKTANYSDKWSPLNTNIDTDVTLNADLGTKIHLTQYFKENFIYDDDVDFVDERQTFSYLDIDQVRSTTGTRLTRSFYCSATQIDSGACEPYIEVDSRASYNKMVIQRKYRKFFESISEIGGFVDLIVYGFWGLYFLYNQWEYSRWIRGQLVDSYVQLQGLAKNRKNGRFGRRNWSRQELRALKTRVVALIRSNSTKNGQKKNLTLEMIFGSLVEIKSLLTLNQKSKVFLEVFTKPYVSTLTAYLMVYQKNSSKLKKSKKSNTNQK